MAVGGALAQVVDGEEDGEEAAQEEEGADGEEGGAGDLWREENAAVRSSQEGDRARVSVGEVDILD